jgi:hypothetical protein
MSCERYTEAIADHACGADLPADAAAHLHACAACAAMFEEERHAIDRMDRELQLALAIEPSAHFERAVHARIEAASTPKPHAIWWTALAAAAAAVIVIGLAAIRWTDDTAIPAAGQVTRAESPAAPAIDPPAATKAVGPPEPGTTTAPTPERSTRMAPRPRVKSSLPEVEVIVAPDQARAIERYMALVRSGAALAPNLSTQTDIGADPPPLVVPPLIVEPLAVSEVGPGPGANTDRGRDLFSGRLQADRRSGRT